MENGLVSVIIPVYNMEEQLKQCMESVRGQTYRKIEIILVNDGSTDGTERVCWELEKEDGRIIVRNQKNKGAGLARNLGMEAARGEYVYFMDADDFLEKQAIEKLMKEIGTGNGYDLIAFSYKIRYSDGEEKIYSYAEREVSGEKIRKNYEQSMTMDAPMALQGMLCNKLFSMELINRYGICFPDLRRGEDEVFIMQYVDKIRRVKFLPDILYEYRQDRYQYLCKYSPEYYKSILEIRNYYLRIVYPWNPENPAILNQINAHTEYGMIRGIKALMTSKTRKNGLWKYRKIKEICKACHKLQLSPTENMGREYRWLREGKAFLLYLKFWKNVKGMEFKLWKK